MKIQSQIYKIVLIALLILIISLLHYGAIKGNVGLHLLHRELYFIPILLASFWFGLKVGLGTAVVISVIYAPHSIIYGSAHVPVLAMMSQVFVFLLVAVILGWLVDRQKIQQKRLLAHENLSVLGRAAAVIANEMHDLLSSLKEMSRKSTRLQCTELDADFAHEMMRLETMVNVVSSFSPSEKMEMISHDLNVIVKEHLHLHAEATKKKGVEVLLDLDENRCPSRVDPVKIRWILDQLIKNALEVSTPGQTIWIRSRRGGNICRIEVQDQGPGIRSEHLPNMFAPFFTTKKNGQGLALAGCRKVLRDLGGDITVRSIFKKGATFTMMIPRDKPSESLAEDAIATANRLNNA